MSKSQTQVNVYPNKYFTTGEMSLQVKDANIFRVGAQWQEKTEYKGRCIHLRSNGGQPECTAAHRTNKHWKVISATELGGAWFWLCINTFQARNRQWSGLWFIFDQRCLVLQYGSDMEATSGSRSSSIVINSVINYVSESIGEKSAVE